MEPATAGRRGRSGVCHLPGFGDLGQSADCVRAAAGGAGWRQMHGGRGAVPLRPGALGALSQRRQPGGALPRQCAARSQGADVLAQWDPAAGGAGGHGLHRTTAGTGVFQGGQGAGRRHAQGTAAQALGRGPDPMGRAHRQPGGGRRGSGQPRVARLLRPASGGGADGDDR